MSIFRQEVWPQGNLLISHDGRLASLAKNTEEFDRRFDSGEDIHDLIDMSRAEVISPGRKVRITLDISESLVKEIDEKKNE